MNVYSLVIRPLPAQMAEVKARLLTVPGVEIHQEHEGRLIVTVEDVPGYRCSEALTAIQSFSGVMSTTLVYEFCDDGLVEKAAAQS